MLQTGVIILCHGSRGEKAVVEIPRVMRNITEGVRPFLPEGIKVVWAALQFNHPDLMETADALVADGMQRIVVMPYFLFSGNHITGDIPEEVEVLRGKYSQVQFIITKPLGMEESFISYVADRIGTAVPELSCNSAASQPAISEIELQSMQIVETLLPPGLSVSENEKSIIKRIVHATGDPQIAEQICFHPDAVAAGLSAIEKGNPIYTDVRMVGAGINRQSVHCFGITVQCALDVAGSKPEAGNTRSAAAFLNLGSTLEGAVVAIGNAPTALLSLIDLIDRGISPALVIGMPVGFVQAAESKTELGKRDIPYITIHGYRGGSPAAAATVNALLRLASEAAH